MRASAVAYAFVAFTAVGSATAEAGVFKLFGEVSGGGMFGRGTGGDLVNNDTNMFDEAFFENAGPLAYGLQVGAQFLFLEGHIQHMQYKGFSDDAQKPGLATWTSIHAGMRFEIGIGTQTEADKKNGKGAFFEGGWNIGFGIGTGAQVMPPLSNDEVTDKGFFAEGRIGVGKHLNTIFDIGVMVPVSYGYYFKNGDGAAVNDLSTHYQSLQVSALLTLRANVRLF
ncbi:MAG: hypothetical protein AB7T06_19265 [Kofleriaceae bacterium]